MITIKIVSRYDSGNVLFECEAPADLESGLHMGYALGKATVADANLSGANLSGAYLSGLTFRSANLSDADFRGANLSSAALSGADLRDADFRNADLRGVDLRGADLRGADLRGVNLSDAFLRGVDLRGAYLRDANFRSADLRGANFCDADLSGANFCDADLSDVELSDFDLSAYRADFWDVLLRAPHEIAGVRAALIEGRVDGSTYNGECACLVGTIGNVRHAEYTELGNGLRPNSGRPAEQWFMSIRKGDTPETNQQSKLAVEWLDELVALLVLSRSAALQGAVEEAR